jgi:hypothetical protein
VTELVKQQVNKHSMPCNMFWSKIKQKMENSKNTHCVSMLNLYEQFMWNQLGKILRVVEQQQNKKYIGTCLSRLMHVLQKIRKPQRWKWEATPKCNKQA